MGESYFDIIKTYEYNGILENYGILNLKIIPKDFIKDIYLDYSDTIIPFSNGKKYYVYQDIVFKIMYYYGLMINIQIIIEDGVLPIILIKSIRNNNDNLNSITNIISNYINDRFSCFI